MRRIKAILRDHGIKFEMRQGKLFVLTSYSKNGQYFEDWIPGPLNEKALLHWLGY